MKFLPVSIGLTCFVSLSLLFSIRAPAFGQAPHQVVPPAALEVIANDGAGVEKHLFSHNGVVDELVVNPNQAVPVTLQFPADKAGTRVAVGSLDGGEVNGSNLILPTGKLIFTFRGTSPGRYRLLAQLPAEQYRLEIYVIDPNRPRNPRLRAAN
jgi:hypothetical protein